MSNIPNPTPLRGIAGWGLRLALNWYDVCQPAKILLARVSRVRARVRVEVRVRVRFYVARV